MKSSNPNPNPNLTQYHIYYLHSPKGLLGTPVQFLMNAII